MRVKDDAVSGEYFQLMQCNTCGLVFTNPRPTEEEAPQYYESEEYISHSNTQEGIINKMYHLVRKVNIRKKFSLVQSLTAGGTLLDVGCGTGEFLNYAKRRGWKVAGVEPAERARNFARQRYGLSVSDPQDLCSMSAGSFNVITLWHVLEHVHSLRSYAERLSAILKKGGVLIVAVPNRRSLDARIYGDKWAAYDVPRHLYHFTRENLPALFEPFDLELATIHPMRWDAYYVSLLSEKYAGGSFLKGILNGWRSNLWARFSGGEYSSLIYVFKKAISSKN